MNNKVKNIHEARAIFDLLGIKDVTKPWQKEKGTQVFELPFKDSSETSDVQLIIDGHRYKVI